MSASVFIEYVTDVLFTLIFLVVVVGAIRRPSRVQFQATLFFGAVFYILMESLILHRLHASTPAIVSALNQIVLLSMSYLLLRLVDNLSDIPPVVLRVGEVGLVLLSMLSLAGLADRQFSFVLPAIIYFFAFTVYATYVAANASRSFEGVTSYRLRAVAAGTVFLGSILVVAGLGDFFHSIRGTGAETINGALALTCGVSFYIAFATPLILRRSWQEPVLRDFFVRAVALPQISDRRVMLERLEEGARISLGGVAASVALWDEDERELLFPTRSIGVEHGNPVDMIEGAAFLAQEPVYSSHLNRDYPNSASVYVDVNASSVVSAPISSRDRRIGVLSVYLTRLPIFVEDDLNLLRLMADQSGVILESRALVEEETILRAREQALKLRNDFLSSVAHDLKTPLTALVMQTQLLERRARKSPGLPTDVEGLHQIIVQTHRLRSFIEDLLDVQRSDDQGIALNYEPCDLVALIAEIGQRVCVEPHTFAIDDSASVTLSGDCARLTQLFDNLIGNAVKYSPDGGEISARIWQSGDNAHVTITDHGIGIAEKDLSHVFERHHRGDMAVSRGVHGIGLGLFICRAITDAHGGKLDVESAPERGSTFHATLPLVPRSLTEPRIAPHIVPAEGERKSGWPQAIDDPINNVALGGHPSG